jgi:AbrB family looped-hinge helix DNA binding protein
MQLTSKGQVTVPKRYRDKYGLWKGTEVEFVEDKSGLKLIKCVQKDSPFDQVRGILRHLVKKGKKGRFVDDLIEDLRGR